MKQFFSTKIYFLSNVLKYLCSVSQNAEFFLNIILNAKSSRWNAAYLIKIDEQTKVPCMICLSILQTKETVGLQHLSLDLLVTGICNNGKF